jgi:ABC-type transport system involved in cytochrome c biogenesis permease subunit
MGRLRATGPVGSAMTSVQLARPLVALCAVAAVAGLPAWFRPESRALLRLADGLGAACLTFCLAAWTLRFREAGHLPLFGTYESSLSLALAVLLGAALLRPWLRNRVALWPSSCTAAAAILAHGLSFDRTVYALTISESSWVVEVHAIVAWGAFAAFAGTTGLGVLLLLRGIDPLRGERWLIRSLGVGFALHSAMLASGSLYKFLLFGRAWSFDPVETLSLVAWLSYGTLLHMHLFAGWSGRRLAGWCLGLFLLLTVSYRGIVYFPAWSTYHIFDMDLRIHVSGSEPFSEGNLP